MSDLDGFCQNAFSDLNSLNQQVFKANYAVRGALAILADEIQDDLLENPSSYPFSEIVYANIGNPQQMGQSPITFVRQVLSLCQYPTLLDHAEEKWFQNLFPTDVVQRSKMLLKESGSLGAYSASQGIPLVRRHVADFIRARDGFDCEPSDIYLTSGASHAARLIMTLIIARPTDGVMVPAPQYPLYGAQIDLMSGSMVSYSLSEKNNWDIDFDQFKKSFDEASKKGINVRLCVVINPGNPTGACISENSMEKVLRFAKAKGIVLLADEVYQNNIYQNKFHSFRRKLGELREKEPDNHWDQVSLISVNSVSKGQFGECGQRGGYLDVVNIPEPAKDQILKLATIDICPPVAGQLLVDMLVNPPKPGDPSYDLFIKEVDEIHEALRLQCRQLYEGTKRMKRVSCLEPHGAMYLHPSVSLPEKLITTAKAQKIQPDEFYAIELLKRSGICVVPGSGFGQPEGDYHIRITFLAKGTEYIERFVKAHNEIMDLYE
ncbi:putative alanine aminotransferase [Schizosaccharomyces pombe]